jgi:hypothetical protein
MSCRNMLRGNYNYTSYPIYRGVTAPDADRVSLVIELPRPVPEEGQTQIGERVAVVCAVR